MNCSRSWGWAHRGALGLLCLVVGLAAGCASVESASHADRMAALAKEKDQRKLYGYATNERLHEDVRDAAFKRLTRADLLYLIVQNKEEWPDRRKAALGKIGDDAVLYRVAADGQFEREFRHQAVESLKGNEALARLAMDGSIDESVREVSLKRIHDDEMLLKVAQSPGAGRALRVVAIKRIAGDEIRAEALRVSDLPEAELLNVLRRIADEDVLGAVMVDSRVPPMLRQEAAQRVSDEDILVEYAVDSTVPMEDRQRAALRLYSSEACERGLRDGHFPESVQLQLAEHIAGDAVRVRLLNAGDLFSSVKRKLAEGIGDSVALAGVLGDRRLDDSVRQLAADSLKRDVNLLRSTFRQSRDLQGAVMALERLPSEATANTEDQRRILEWFKVAENSGRADARAAMNLFAGRMTMDGARWYVAEVGPHVPEDLRAECLGRIGDTNLLCKAALRRGDSLKVRAAAIEALETKHFDLHRLLGAGSDTMSRILVLQHLPKKEVKSPGIQRRLVEWFMGFGNSEDELDARSRLIGLLAPEAEVDGEGIQKKIAQTLVARDSTALRRAARMLVVDPGVVEGLVCQEYGLNSGVAEWAVGLIAGDAWLARAAERATNPDVLYRVAARTDREDVLSRIVQGNGPASLRAATAKRLGKDSERLLQTLAEGAEAGVADGALAALERIDAEVATAVKERRAAAERARELDRQSMLDKRDREDQATLTKEETELRNKADSVLAEEYGRLKVLADIRTCKAWGRLQEQGKWVLNQEMSFPGHVTAIKKHWFRADELWMDIESPSERYRMYAKTSDLNGADVGSRVRVAGRFVAADSSEVKLKKAIVSWK